MGISPAGGRQCYYDHAAISSSAWARAGREADRGVSMSNTVTVNIGLILLVACIVAMASQRLRLPYSVGLVTAGLLLALLPVGVAIPLSPDGIFTIFLPPLIFEAALQIRWPALRDNLPVILLLAVPGAMCAAAVVAAGMHLLIGWGWLGAAMFGFLIAATDPVSVIATFKELKVAPRLRLLVEAESLLNDGTAAVGFAVLIAIAGAAGVDPIAITSLLLWKVVGGVIIGGVVATGLLFLAGRTEDHLVEITLTTIIAYGAFLIAERLATSGVLAALTAGLVVGNIGWRGYISQSGRGHVLAFWDYATFLANSVIFIQIGLQEAHEAAGLLSRAAGIAILLVLLGRAVAVYALCPLFSRSKLAVGRSYQHVLMWGGLRGALALVLALTLPHSIPERSEIVIAAFAVVAFSIFVQGLTISPLIRYLRLVPD
jgi:monovalent cation:H+ antiporter, CPA1 family